MHLSTSALALALLTFTSALPMAPHADPTFDPPTAASSSSCPQIPDAPTDPNANPVPNPVDPAIKPRGTIRPSYTSLYSVSSGSVRYASDHGKISKTGGAETDVSTLLTFAIPEEAQGKTCSFHFGLPSSSAVVTGTREFDVFLSQSPAAGNSAGWPSGNLRDHHVGRMLAKSGAEATWVPGISVGEQKFPCPPVGKYGGELVGAGDKVLIEWAADNEGPYILWEEEK